MSCISYASNIAIKPDFYLKNMCNFGNSKKFKKKK